MPPKVHKRFDDDGDTADLPIVSVNEQVATTTSKKNKNKKKNKKKNKANANQEQNHAAQPVPLPDSTQNGQQKTELTNGASEQVSAEPSLEQSPKEPVP